MMMKIKAYAKLNLYLEVMGKRQDGYHDLRMIMTSIDLHDAISITENTHGAICITSDSKDVPTNSDNIVYKIVDHLKSVHHVSSGVDVHIEKRIPIGGGMAGGSSDAAAVLRALNDFWKLGLSDSGLIATALKFGSDIPYCLFHKPSLATSRGEILEFIPVCYEGFVLIVNPKIHVSTKEAFSNYVAPKTRTPFVLEHFHQPRIFDYAASFHNDLEPSVIDNHPEIKHIIDYLKHQGIAHPRMSGSGATVFVVFDCEEDAQRAATGCLRRFPDHLVGIHRFIG